MDYSHTATEILDAAQELVQTRGFNAFSYRDLADRVGIRTASIHYHFPAKADLGLALVERYREVVGSALDQILETHPDAPSRLRAYAALLEGVLTCGGERVCLGGMLASDFATLPDEMQRGVRRFVEEHEDWIAHNLEAGRADGSLRFEGPARAGATALFGGLEGAMLVARSCGDLERYRQTASWLLRGLGA
jgi:TetR/AcrR family transcriptional regulator, transcriptional repressor for nem operon